jgi:hypothetical protein
VANGFEDQIKDHGPSNVGGESSSNFLGQGELIQGKRVLHVCLIIQWFTYNYYLGYYSHQDTI